jgi:hypothetical protein
MPVPFQPIGAPTPAMVPVHSPPPGYYPSNETYPGFHAPLAPAPGFGGPYQAPGLSQLPSLSSTASSSS